MATESLQQCFRELLPTYRIWQRRWNVFEVSGLGFLRGMSLSLSNLTFFNTDFEILLLFLSLTFKNLMASQNQNAKESQRFSISWIYFTFTHGHSVLDKLRVRDCISHRKFSGTWDLRQNKIGSTSRQAVTNHWVLRAELQKLRNQNGMGKFRELSNAAGFITILFPSGACGA